MFPIQIQHSAVYPVTFQHETEQYPIRVLVSSYQPLILGLDIMKVFSYMPTNTSRWFKNTKNFTEGVDRIMLQVGGKNDKYAYYATSPKAEKKFSTRTAHTLTISGVIRLSTLNSVVCRVYRENHPKTWKAKWDAFSDWLLNTLVPFMNSHQHQQHQTKQTTKQQQQHKRKNSCLTPTTTPASSSSSSSPSMLVMTDDFHEQLLLDLSPTYKYSPAAFFEDTPLFFHYNIYDFTYTYNKDNNYNTFFENQSREQQEQYKQHPMCKKIKIGVSNNLSSLSSSSSVNNFCYHNNRLLMSPSDCSSQKNATIDCTDVDRFLSF